MRVVLSHNPDTVEDLRVYHSDLILAGHAHGGLECFPWPIKYIIPYLIQLPDSIRELLPHHRTLNVIRNWQWGYGFHQITPQPDSTTPSTLLYTTSGICRLPPRYLCPAEIAIFTLTPKPATSFAS